MSSRLSLRVGCVVVAVLAATGQSQTATAPAAASASSAMLDSTLPIPPMQREAWTAPKCDVPADVIDATRRLFEQGLADPRGCAYRVVSINIGHWLSNESVRVGCHAWVLPDGENRKSQYAVCWNGLVYPVVEVKEPADLQQDVASLLKEDAAFVAKQDKDGASYPITLRLCAWSDVEEQTVSLSKLEAIRQALLLRLGEGDLASKIHRAWRAPTAHITDLDPFEDMATALAWSEFERAMSAHVRGDDRLALASGRWGVAMQQWYDAAWKRAKKRDEDDRSPYFFLSVLPQLVADEERRLSVPHKPIVVINAKTFPDKKQRIAALIEQLDTIDTASPSTGGELLLDPVPIVRALVDCGDDAVDPLLNVLENDNRLMRSIHFYDFAGNPPKYTPAGVCEAAYTALNEILNTSFYLPSGFYDDLTGAGPEDRKKFVETIRTYWFAYRNLPPKERWFKMLADDSRADRWQQAMDNVLQAGESLRSHQNPSVSDVLLKHIELLNRPVAPKDFNDQVPHVKQATRLAFNLNQWDAQRGRDALSKQLDRCIDVATDETLPFDRRSLSQQICQLAETLHMLGDPSALQRYGKWVPTLPPDDPIGELQQVVQPFWRYPDDPAIAAVAEAMFNGPKSKWNPILTPRYFTDSWYEEVVSSRLLELASFRRQVLRCLNSTTPVAYLTVDEKNRVEYHDYKHEYINNPNIKNVPDGDPQSAGPGTLTLRECDRYAKMVSMVHGAPAMEYHWPVATRDAAIGRVRNFLTHYASCIRTDARFTRDQNPDVFSFDTAQVIFPPIGRPATADDVASNRAIFSLEGRGERRLVALPTVPTPATWTTLQKYPQDRWGRPKLNQSCQIWQAEEVNVGGKWERYFGVVGPHEITMVPAVELELDNGQGWTPLSKGLNLHISFPGTTPDGRDRPSFAAGAPVNVQLLACNRFGLAHDLPAHIIGVTAGGIALRPGMALSVERMKPNLDGKIGDKPGTPILVKLSGLLAGQQLKETRLAEGFSSVESASFNLRDFCDLNEPGTYQIHMKFMKSCELGEGDRLAPFVIRQAGL